MTSLILRNTRRNPALGSLPWLFFLPGTVYPHLCMVPFRTLFKCHLSLTIWTCTPSRTQALFLLYLCFCPLSLSGTLFTSLSYLLSFPVKMGVPWGTLSVCLFTARSPTPKITYLVLDKNLLHKWMKKITISDKSELGTDGDEEGVRELVKRLVSQDCLFNKHLLSTRHSSRCWGYEREQNRRKSLPLWNRHLLRVQTI